MLTFLLVAVFVLLSLDVVSTFLIWKWFRAMEGETNLLMAEVLKLRQETSAGKEPANKVANIVPFQSRASTRQRSRTITVSRRSEVSRAT
jgi:hypothetical protein